MFSIRSGLDFPVFCLVALLGVDAWFGLKSVGEFGIGWSCSAGTEVRWLFLLGGLFGVDV